MVIRHVRSTNCFLRFFVLPAAEHGDSCSKLAVPEMLRAGRRRSMVVMQAANRAINTGSQAAEHGKKGY